MNFNSLPFLCLVAVTFFLYYAPWLHRHQLAVLVAASLFFYAYGQPYLLLLLLASVAVNAVCSFAVLRTRSQRQKAAIAIGGVAFNLALLATFKYDHLLGGMLGDLATGKFANFLLTLPLPIGISFYTFHGISLVIDVFKRGDPAMTASAHDGRSLGQHVRETLLYLTFFPQLIAGPIVKAHFFFPQIGPKALQAIDWDVVARNLVTGYFLKSVVADNLQDQTFAIFYPYFLNFSSANLLMFLLGYSIQIFADFAGYSLIAIGLAALFGYCLPQNFNFPYLSQSFSEFWTRWHMSLSSFLREYLYYPLGGNRKGRVRTYANLMIVMVLGGLWHGATLSYAVWGFWHGLALVLERPFLNTWFYRSGNPILCVIRIAIVFAVVTLGWLLFKLPNFSEALAYLAAIQNNRDAATDMLRYRAVELFILPVIAYYLMHLVRTRAPALIAGGEQAIYGVMLSGILLNSGRPHAFIYFQF
jgi:alginate O-acetyltransferase complex protein AlgI